MKIEPFTICDLKKVNEKSNFTEEEKIDAVMALLLDIDYKLTRAQNVVKKSLEAVDIND